MQVTRSVSDGSTEMKQGALGVGGEVDGPWWIICPSVQTNGPVQGLGSEWVRKQEKGEKKEWKERESEWVSEEGGKEGREEMRVKKGKEKKESKKWVSEDGDGDKEVRNIWVIEKGMKERKKWVNKEVDAKKGKNSVQKKCREAGM